MMNELLKLNHEFGNYTVSNDTMRKAFVTEIFTDMLAMMQSTIDLADSDSLDNVTNRVKLFMYFGTHNLCSLANTLNFTFQNNQLLAFGSLLRFDLIMSTTSTS